MESSRSYLVLGPLLVESDGVLRAPTARKQRLLLTRLLLSVDEAVSSDRLIDAVWGEKPPASARKLVQLYIHELRELLDPEAIETLADGYRLRAAREALDSVRFEGLAEEGRRLLDNGNADLARTTLRRALDLWRGGPAYGDAAYEQFARLEAERLEELRLDCLEARCTADAVVGAADAAELQSLVADHPHREGFRAALMLAFYRSGRQTEALAVYEQGRLLLDEQLGLEPGPRLRNLQRQILNQDPQLDATDVSQPAAPPLPVAPTPLLGRDDALRALAQLTERPGLRLLTIVGAGGIGKSRLALELAHRLRPRFANGAYLVELAQVREPRHLPALILAALGGVEPPGMTTTAALRRFLGEQEVLLVLDNVEHLPTIGEDLAALTRNCPRLTVVATSRRVLHLTGEQVYPVAPLESESAAELFRTRAEAAAPSSLTDRPADSVVEEICRRLDNLPLAIELAAARTATLTLEALLSRLDDRLGLLVNGPRDLPDRQRTLRETLRWSADLLTETERNGLARLGTFTGSCSLSAAECVADLGVDELHTLVTHSLVNRTVLDGQPRFVLLETVREYAVELLGSDQKNAEHRHASFHADLAFDYYTFLIGPDYLDGAYQEKWLKQLDAEATNLRAAVDWSVREQQATLALRLVAGLWRYRYVRGQLSEGLDEAERALAIVHDADPKLVAAVLVGGAGLAWASGRRDLATTLAEKALALAPDDLHACLNAENVLGLVANQDGKPENARRHFERMRDLAVRLGSEADAITAVNNLGDAAFKLGDYTTATAHWLNCLSYWQGRGSREGIGGGSLNLGVAALRTNHLDEAEDHLREALSNFEAIGFREQVGNALVGQAAVATRRGDAVRATRLFGAALAILDDVGSAGTALANFEPTLADETETHLRALLGNEQFEQLLVEGRQNGTDSADRAS